jgi:hypothetical protein
MILPKTKHNFLMELESMFFDLSKKLIINKYRIIGVAHLILNTKANDSKKNTILSLNVLYI